MSIELFKTTFKRNWLLLVIFFGVLTMYMGVMISMFNPDSMQELADMLALFPAEVQNALGFSSTVSSLTSYLASWLYGMLMFGFPMVYCIILGGRLVAKMVDNGSFAYLLSTPNSRAKIIVTQGLYALLSLVVLFAALYGVGVGICSAAFPGVLDEAEFLRLNLTTLLVNMTVMMVCFFFSCLFSDAKWAVGLGAGVPIVFLLMNMLGGAAHDAEVLKDASIYGFYDPVELVAGGEVWGPNTIYLCAIAVLFVAAVLIFRKKRLPL